MTLPEVLIAGAIGTGIVGAATWFLVEGARSSYKAMASVEDSVQQWALTTKLQIDGKVANGVSIFLGADPSIPLEYLKIIPVDDNISANGLERGRVLVLTKSKLNQGLDTGVITDLIFYLYTPGASTAPGQLTGTLKRYKNAPLTFKVPDPLDGAGKAKTVSAIVDEYIDTLTGTNLVVVQDHVASLANAVGPFGSFGSGNHVSIALVREETKGNQVVSNLTEVSFNLR
jgi:hypothetical protein